MVKQFEFSLQGFVDRFFNAFCLFLNSLKSADKLVFEVKAFDECGQIGGGRHERFIIDNEKFIAKANAKGAK